MIQDSNSKDVNLPASFDSPMSSNFSTTSCNGNNIKPTLRGAVVYTNADAQKLQILKENKCKSGIYR